MEKFDFAVNKRIVEIRKTLGYTQKQFAKELKISASYEGHLERGLRPVNSRIAGIVCSAFNVSEEWLFAGKGPQFAEADPQIERIVNGIKKLPPAARRYAVKLIELLVEYEKGK